MVIPRRHLLKLPCVLGVPAPAVASEADPLIALQPLGAEPARLELEAVSRALVAFYAVRLQLGPTLPLPRRAFYARRKRYRAERLLEYLVERSSPEVRVTLGLLRADISTSKPPYDDWGILGLSTLDGRSAVLSSFRCQRGAKNAAHARERFAKTAVHELGHAFGLEHCPTPGCLMHDGEGSVRTTDTEHDLCDVTRRRLSLVGLLRPDAKTPFALP